MTEPVSSNVNTGVSEGSGRFSITTEPPLPATCVVCSRSSNGVIKFIDFNFNMDYYGAVLFCEDCIKESLSLLNYVPFEREAEVLDKLVETRKELEVAVSELTKYRAAFDGLAFIRPDLNPLSVDDESELEEPNEAVGASKPADSERLETESDSDGSDSSGGPKDFSLFAD